MNTEPLIAFCVTLVVGLLLAAALYVTLLLRERNADQEARFTIRPRNDDRPECSLCRDEVGPKGWRCKRCNTALHRKCRKELNTKKCPTVGCGKVK